MDRYLRHRAAPGLILLALLLCGCAAASLEELRQARPSGSAFHSALAKYYLAFAESEAAQYDWADARHFADKGLLAAYGKDAAPEDPSRWNVPEAMLPELMAGYEKLMAALAPPSAAARPELAAHAQFLYDCWVEQQEENWQPDDIAACRDGFYEIIDRMQGEQEDAAQQQSTASSAYIVFFDWNSAALTAAAKQAVDAAIADLKTAGRYEVTINGHADRSGGAEYNLDLSQKRVESVKRALIAGGVPDGFIALYAFGESDARIPTGDGVREPGNRRVEIFLNP